MRERGLKSCLAMSRLTYNIGRSREGAWIEIPPFIIYCILNISRSREGAWIEILPKRNNNESVFVAPVRERGLK